MPCDSQFITTDSAFNVARMHTLVILSISFIDFNNLHGKFALFFRGVFTPTTQCMIDQRRPKRAQTRSALPSIYWIQTRLRVHSPLLHSYQSRMQRIPYLGIDCNLPTALLWSPSIQCRT